MRKEKNRENVKQTFVSVGIIIGAVILLLLAAIFGNIQGGEEEDLQEDDAVVELNLCYPYRNAQWNSAMESIIAAFEETCPDIQINVDVPYADSVYENELNKRIARGEFGDIVQLKTPKAYALSGLLGEFPEEFVKDCGIEDVYEESGSIYGLGIVNSTSGILYNKDIFAAYDLEVPETYEEFLEICEVLSANGVTPIGVGGDDLWHMEYWVNHFFRADVLSEKEDWQVSCSDGSVSWTDEEITVMLRHLLDVFQSGYVNEDWLSTADGSLPYMMSEGEVAMIYTGSWTADEIYALNEEINLGWFYVPDEEGTLYIDEMQDTFWSVSLECAEDEEKYEAATAFLSFFYSEENYSVMLDTMTAFPTTDGVYDFETTVVQDEVLEEFDENGIHITGYIGDAQTPQGFEEELLTYVQKMLAGSLSLEDTGQLCQEAWEKELEAAE